MSRRPPRRPAGNGLESLERRCLLSAGAGPKVAVPGAVSAEAAPMSATLALSSKSNPDGNGVVGRARVMLVGRTAPGASVRLVEGDALASRSTRADPEGDFRMPVVVRVGENPMEVIATDSTGRRASAAMTVDRGNVVVAWNRTAADVMRAAKENVGMTSRNFAIVAGAMYDAVDSISPAHAPYELSMKAPAGASADAAASAAAYQVLLGLYPAQKATLDATLAETTAAIPGKSKALGIALGSAIGADELAMRADDGSAAKPAYKVGTAPGAWRPTPPDYRNAWGPAWGDVTPFALASVSPFEAPPPPALDSPQYAAAVNQVESLGAADSATRTADQTQAGIFWAYDTAGMGPPPILYNQVLEQVALQKRDSMAQDARLFALADMAMADAGIAAWQSKYDYNLWRPITAIRQADTDGNPATTADPTWTPLGSPGEGVLPDYTPPFPSYVSGHATFGGALFTVLADFYGTDKFRFTLTSDELPGVTRSYDSFSEASEENGLSRIYLGVHYSFDVTAGLAVGDNIGNAVVRSAMKS